jgi:hypothetical protein
MRQLAVIGREDRPALIMPKVGESVTEAPSALAEAGWRDWSCRRTCCRGRDREGQRRDSVALGRKLRITVPEGGRSRSRNHWGTSRRWRIVAAADSQSRPERGPPHSRPAAGREMGKRQAANMAVAQRAGRLLIQRQQEARPLDTHPLCSSARAQCRLTQLPGRGCWERIAWRRGGTSGHARRRRLLSRPGRCLSKGGSAVDARLAK